MMFLTGSEWFRSDGRVACFMLYSHLSRRGPEIGFRMLGLGMCTVARLHHKRPDYRPLAILEGLMNEDGHQTYLKRLEAAKTAMLKMLAVIF